MKAYQLIATSEAWGKGSFQYTTPTGVVYCMVGAIRACYPDNAAFFAARDRAYGALRRLRVDLDIVTLTSFNDDFRTRHEDVISVLLAADV
jgi:hypothetical protein